MPSSGNGNILLKNFVFSIMGKSPEIHSNWEKLRNKRRNNFAQMGCLVKCHPQYGPAGALLDVPDQEGDMWHIKAARSLGVTSQSGSPGIVVAMAIGYLVRPLS